MNKVEQFIQEVNKTPVSLNISDISLFNKDNESVHERKKPYECNHCPGRFDEEKNLKSHVYEMHVSSIHEVFGSLNVTG